MSCNHWHSREHHDHLLNYIADLSVCQAQTTERWLSVYKLRQEEMVSILKALHQSSMAGDEQAISWVSDAVDV